MRSTHCWLAVIHRLFLYYVGKCTVIVLILWSLVEVHSQTAPYVRFMGDILPNHAYVDLTTVGDDISTSSGDTVRCQTDLETCCTSIQGIHRGDWYFPDGSVLPFANNPDSDIVIDREAQEVHLRRRNNAMSPTGIYRCDIETNAVNDNDVDTITGESVYVGLYLPSEGTCAEFPCTSIQSVLVIICP